MESIAINKACRCLADKDILGAINATAQWANSDQSNLAYKFYKVLKDSLFNGAYCELDSKTKKALLLELSHNKYFAKGVTQGYVMEYCYMSSDALILENKILISDECFIMTTVRMTRCMKLYRKVLNNTVRNYRFNLVLFSYGVSLLQEQLKEEKLAS